MTEPTQAEVDAIIDQMDAALALTISPAQLLELAQFTGIEPNFSGLQGLRDQAREALTIREELPPALDRYLATGDESGLEQMQRIDSDRVRRLRPYVWALCILGSWAAVAGVVALVMRIGGML